MGRRLLAPAALLATLLLVPSATAASSAGDAAATRAYVRANYALVAAGHANIARTEADVRAIVGQIRHECPRAALGSPQDEQSTELSNELIGKMVLAGGAPDRPAVARYLRSVESLRWSSRAIDRAIGGYVKMLRTLYRLRAPAICADIASWQASGYRQLPAASGPFVGSFIPDWVSLGVQPAGLARYETSELRAIAKRASRYESDLMEMEARLVETWGEIMNELLLNP
jgi:hypothetical protein